MPKLAAGFVFTHHDRRRLTTALRGVRDARHCRRVQAVLLVAEGKRVGRPRWAPALSTERLAEGLHTDPLTLGYAAASWTAPLLAAHLRRGGVAETLSARTLRRRLHAAGLAWKRPRYVFGQKEPHRAQKKGPSRAV
jgi:transposase